MEGGEALSNPVWNDLVKVDVSAFTEKKNALYLSWADAWSVLKDHYPDGYVKHIFNGLPFMQDAAGNTYVQVTVVSFCEH